MMLIIGIIMALISTIMFNIAPILQKQALDQMNEVSMTNMKDSITSMFKNKRWLLGFILGMIGGLPYTLALNYAGVTVVQPIINFGLLILVIIAKKYLHEELKLSHKLAITGMIAVPFFIAFSGVSQPQADITKSSVQLYFFMILIILGIIIGILALFVKRKPILWAFCSGIMFAMGATLLQATVSVITFLGYDLFEDFGFLISNFFSIPLMWMALVFGLLCLVVNVIATYILQIGLQKADASKAGPINQTLNNIFTVIIGILIFQQNISNFPLYFVGFTIAVISAIILAQFQIAPPET